MTGLTLPPQAGLKHRQTITVTEDLIPGRISPDFSGLAELPPVLATPSLIAFVEWTCHEALRPYLSETERTVGTEVAVKHIDATPVGMKVTAEVELVAVAGKKFEFSFVCLDEAGPIAEGRHWRAAVRYDRFMARVAQKNSGTR